jgi:hypothetical protein
MTSETLGLIVYKLEELKKKVDAMDKESGKSVEVLAEIQARLKEVEELVSEVKAAKMWVHRAAFSIIAATCVYYFDQLKLILKAPL